MGLTYTYPTEWEAVPGDPDPPAKDDAAQRARDVLNACSLMLVRLTPRPIEGADAEGRMITLRAIDQTCLSLPAPAVEDAAREFLPIFIFEGFEETGSDAGGGSDFFQRNLAQFAFPLETFSEVSPGHALCSQG